MLNQYYKAVIFDFDGVLVDSNLIKTQAFIELFQDYGPRVVASVIKHHRLHGGISRVEKIRYAFENFIKAPLVPGHLDRLAIEYSEKVVEKVVNAGWIAGAEEFLNNNHQNFQLFVISGTPEEELRQIIHRRKMARYFKEILGSPVKKPRHIKNLLLSHDLKPKECVFVGDALTDYNAAADTGLDFIGIRGELPFPPNTTVLPDCTALGDIITVIQRRNMPPC